MPVNKSMIKTADLAKSFGDNVAVDRLNLEIRKGELYGLVGPDGAGKTTTMRLLAAIMDPTSGDAWVADCGGYLEFLRIVREFVPEFEQEILGVAKQGGQMAKFASRFEDKYFPLWPMMADGEMETYEELVYQTPVNVMGLSSDEMGEPEQFRNGIQMMLLLIITDSDGEARVPLVNSVLSFLPESLVTMASPLSQGDLHRLLDHTDYQGVADESDIWEHSTGSFFLDADDESSGYEMIDWSHENIEALTEDWHRAEEYNRPCYQAG